MTIPLTSLPAMVDDTRRDRWGRYLVRPPGADRPVGYTRVTTVAKALDEGGGLAPWKATMATCGTILRPALRAQWEGLMATYGTDPWYAGKTAKAECKRLVEEAAAVGGGNDRREIGTLLHTITALVDLGRPVHMSDDVERDVKAYVAGLDEAGVVIITDLIERTVVLDDWQVAGTFDRAVMVPGFERPLIADLKTGADLSYSWQGIAVQLAAYSRANAMYQQGRADDGSGDARITMPDVDQDNGLIMWLNAGTGQLELFLVDLNAGWEAFERSMWTRQWRRATVSMPLTSGGWVRSPGGAVVPGGPASLVPALEASVKAIEARSTDDADTGGGDDAPSPDRSELAPLAPAELRAIRDWLQERIATIGKHPEARADLGLSWPPGMPTLNSSTDHTATQLAEIERLVADVERRSKVIFPRPRPGADDDPVGQVLAMFPHSTVITKDTPA